MSEADWERRLKEIFKPSASWEPNAKVIMENEYVRLMDDGVWYIIEYKPFKDMPVVHRGETKTFVNMIVETGILPDGYPVAIRAKYPKDQFEGESFRIILSTFNSWTRWITKKINELRAYRSLLGGET